MVFAAGIKKIMSLISKVISIIILLIITAAIGNYIITHNNNIEQLILHKRSKTNKPPIVIDWSKVNEDIKKAMKSSENKAKEYAREQLEIINHNLKNRIDNNFLPWYFGYTTQQIIGIKAIYHEISHKIFKNSLSAKEAITEEIQENFAERVLRPEILQMKLNQISYNALKIFLNSLKSKLSKIQESYNIPQEDWDRYLNQISIMINRTNGGREIPISLKAIIGGSASTGILLTKRLTPIISNSLSKISKKLASKTADKVAVKVSEKMGAKVASKFTTEFADPLIGIGILIWDFYDHYETKKENEPILRKNLYDYVDLMNNELLEDIMYPIYQIEEKTIESLTEK